MQQTPENSGNKKEMTAEENARGIENHLKASMHLESASKYHFEAAQFHGAGDHDKAAKSTISAHGHVCLAHEAQKEDVKHHAQSNYHITAITKGT